MLYSVDIVQWYGGNNEFKIIQNDASTVRPKQIGHRFADDILKCILTENIFFYSNPTEVCRLGSNRQ